MPTPTSTHVAARYGDPYPGRRGTDRVDEPCRRCGGEGKLVDMRGNPTSCPFCEGSGARSILVSSARARARREAKEVAARRLHEDLDRFAWRRTLDQVAKESRDLCAAVAHTSRPVIDPKTIAKRKIARALVDDVHHGRLTARDAAADFADYLAANYPSTRRGRNYYPGACRTCGTPVATGAGYLTVLDGIVSILCPQHSSR